MTTPTEKHTKKQILDAYQALLTQVEVGGSKPGSSARPVSTTPSRPALLEIVGKLESLQTMIVEATTAFGRQVAAFQAELRDRQEEFERGMTTQRAAWQREEEEHAYTVKLKHQQSEDEFQTKRRTQEQEFAASMADRQRDLAARTEALAAAEDELKTLRKTVEAFPAELASAVAEAAQQARAGAEQQATITAELAAKDRQREQEVAKLTTQGLEATIKAQVAQIANLERQLAQAVGQAQKLAVSIIEAGSRKAADAGPKPSEE